MSKARIRPELKAAIEKALGRSIIVEKVWVEAVRIRADGTREDLGVVSSSKPEEVTWLGDEHE